MYRLLHIPSFDGKRILFGPSREFTGTWPFRHNAMLPIITPEGYPGQSFAPGSADGDQLYPSLSGDDQTSSTPHERIFGVLAWQRCADITSGTGMGGRLPGATVVEVHPDSRALDETHPHSPPASSLLMEQDAGGEGSDPGDE
jgi:hypothetical protein